MSLAMDAQSEASMSELSTSSSYSTMSASGMPGEASSGMALRTLVR